MVVWDLLPATWRHFWILTYATHKSRSKSVPTWRVVKSGCTHGSQLFPVADKLVLPAEH
jgi:hypothetical protein